MSELHVTADRLTVPLSDVRAIGGRLFVPLCGVVTWHYGANPEESQAPSLGVRDKPKAIVDSPQA